MKQLANGHRQVEIPEYGIVIELDNFHDPIQLSCGGWIMASNLGITKQKSCYNAALHAVESMILSQACAGIDIETPAYAEALEATLVALDNHFN